MASESIYSDGRYIALNPDWHAGRQPWKARHVLKGLNAAGLAPKTICDVGCGTGIAVAIVAEELGAQRAVGFEPSSDAPPDDAALTRVEFRREDATKASETFNCAMMLDVFEHVEDMFQFLRDARSLSDYFVFHIPLDANCLTVLRSGFMGPRRSLGHLHYFTDESACATLRDCGYDIIHSHFTKAGWDGPGRNAWSPLNLARRIVYAVSPRFAHRLLGGLSLLVVARTR
ncbi:MAG: class I SAM-dependent methyltransferase [Oceanicaulis sp.]